MEKNPFSLFDFLGYFIPGSFALFLVYFLQNQDGLQFYFRRGNIETLKTDISIIYMTFFIILAYTLGHILSFLSTLTIENFTIWKFGYPSKNLLGIYSTNRYFQRKCRYPPAVDWIPTILSFILRLLLGAFLAPISLSSISIGKMLDLNRSVYTKKLGEPYVSLIKTKIIDRFRLLDPTLTIDFTNHDYNKLLIHHSYDVNASHQSKLMNYVALYGFLRVTCFILNILTLYMLLYICWHFPEEFTIELHKSLSAEFVIFLVSGFMTYVCYLGYLKFYRRYSQENLMIMLL